MEDSLAWALGTFVLTIVAFGLRWAVLRFAGTRDIAALPANTDRIRYMTEVRRMRAQDHSLQDCVAHLRQYGLRPGVARGMVLDMEREDPAAVDRPREGEWRGFRFSYPGNWRLTPLLPKRGCDPGISIDGIGSAIFFLVALDAEQSLQETIAEWDEQIRDPDRTRTSSWGTLRGEGTRLCGEHAKVHVPMEIAIFRPAQVDPPFVLMHLHAVEEAQLVTPGFDLIRDTFRLRGDI